DLDSDAPRSPRSDAPRSDPSVNDPRTLLKALSQTLEEALSLLSSRTSMDQRRRRSSSSAKKSDTHLQAPPLGSDSATPSKPPDVHGTAKDESPILVDAPPLTAQPRKGQSSSVKLRKPHSTQDITEREKPCCT